LDLRNEGGRVQGARVQSGIRSSAAIAESDPFQRRLSASDRFPQIAEAEKLHYRRRDCCPRRTREAFVPASSISYGSHKHTPLVYYAFDLLSLEGSDLRSRPLIERRELLAKLLKKAPENIKFSEELRGTKDELLRVARQFQLEGLTAKRPNSLYESGRRSGAWVKVKLTQEQEFVIGGYTPPEGGRKYFGALLVGYYSTGGLLFAGRVGTGFSEKALATLYEGIQKIRRANCPFVNLPEKKPGHWGLGVTPAVMKRCTWVEPILIAQIKFTEWTSDDQLRQPVFLGLRSDKDPKHVVRE